MSSPPALVTLQVAWNPTTMAAHVQTSGSALPGGSINAGTFQHQVADPPMRANVQRVLFHGVRDVLYKRNLAGQVAFFPDNITTLQGIPVTADANVPRALMGEDDDGSEDPPMLLVDPDEEPVPSEEPPVN